MVLAPQPVRSSSEESHKLDGLHRLGRSLASEKMIVNQVQGNRVGLHGHCRRHATHSRVGALKAVRQTGQLDYRDAGLRGAFLFRLLTRSMRMIYGCQAGTGDGSGGVLERSAVASPRDIVC